MTLTELARTLRESAGFAHKRDIHNTVAELALALPAGTDDLAGAVPVGDDCAAIADGNGYLLFAIEGFLNEFVIAQPWFAGWCGVMVNLSDIAAMGGRPVAVVDALWSRDNERAAPVLQGLAAAAAAYDVPIVGGHSNARNDREQLAVAVLGRATCLLTSFDARPGDQLLAAIDLRGRYREPYSNWDAATNAPPSRLRADLEILPALAEERLCRAAKDISMAGTVGTALMLLECSGLGAVLDVSAVPRPAGVPLARWLTSFPSFGFLLAVPPAQTSEVIARFVVRDIACAAIGTADETRSVRLSDGNAEVPFWDLCAQPFIGCGSTPIQTSIGSKEVAHA